MHSCTVMGVLFPLVAFPARSPKAISPPVDVPTIISKASVGWNGSLSSNIWQNQDIAFIGDVIVDKNNAGYTARQSRTVGQGLQSL